MKDIHNLGVSDPMPKIAHTAFDMVSGMSAVLQPGSFVFVTTDNFAVSELLIPDAISFFREDEGTSMVIPVDVAEQHRLNVEHPMRCITLKVFSSLEGIGLTAAVSTALGKNGIPCNMVAAFHHDHIFVPSTLGEKAIEVLAELQKSASDFI